RSRASRGVAAAKVRGGMVVSSQRLRRGYQFGEKLPETIHAPVARKVAPSARGGGFSPHHHAQENSMFALTVRQPYASLLVLGFKEFECRSWPTRHRGPLLIHAAAFTDAGGRRVADGKRCESAQPGRGDEGPQHGPAGCRGGWSGRNRGWGQ